MFVLQGGSEPWSRFPGDSPELLEFKPGKGLVALRSSVRSTRYTLCFSPCEGSSRSPSCWQCDTRSCCSLLLDEAVCKGCGVKHSLLFQSCCPTAADSSTCIVAFPGAVVTLTRLGSTLAFFQCSVVAINPGEGEAFLPCTDGRCRMALLIASCSQL